MVFYVDIYLILNFIMNLFLLILTGIFRKKYFSVIRVVFVSLLFSVISALATYQFWNYRKMQLLFGIIEMGGLLYVSFIQKSLREWWKDFLLFIFLTMFLGGSITAILNILMKNDFIRGINGIILVVGSVIAIFIVIYLLKHFYISVGVSQNNVYSVTITDGMRSITSLGCMDTGNNLISPYTGEYVVVVSSKIADYLELKKNKRPIVIPYNSIGGSGILEGYRVDKIDVKTKKSCNNVLVAVSDELYETDEVQVILNILWS